MKLILTIALLFCINSLVAADVLCVKNRIKVRAGRVNLANKVKVFDADSCPQRHSLVKDLDDLQDQRLTAYAKISGDGSVLSYGGANVTGVNVSQPFAGRFEITFTGNFDLPVAADPADNAALFTVMSSAVADNYGSTNNNIESASPSEITVTVFLWRSDSLTDEFQAGVNVTILQGVAPLS